MKEVKKLISVLVLLVLLFVFIWSLVFLIIVPMLNIEPSGYCGDGTYQGRCSHIQPYYCINETLIENGKSCGCPESFSLLNGNCISNFQTGKRTINLTYFLDGQKNSFEFTVYAGVVDYLSKLDKSISSSNSISRADFETNALNESVQSQFLLPLVAEIYNLGKSNSERFDIAVSLVQSFEYSASEKEAYFYGVPIEYSRYPYEVVYDQKGICGEKSQLLAFILRDMGYDVVLFYFPIENHEAVGVKCSRGDFRDTGYCYIETTNIFEIGIDPADVIGTGEFTTFDTIFISDGKSYN